MPAENGSPQTDGYEARQAALQRLSALLTHRLSTLTSTISGYAELLVDTPTPREQRKMAMNVLETSSEIDDLLKDLRYFSHPLQPAFRTTAVSTLVQRTLVLLDDDERSRVQLEADAASTLRADPQMLRQALLGLLHNALEATAPGGPVHLRVIAGEAREENSSVRFEVWNEGAIPLEEPGDIFRPFFTTYAQRLGLGLPIAQQIAEHHGGTLQLARGKATEENTCLVLRVWDSAVPQR